MVSGWFELGFKLVHEVSGCLGLVKAFVSGGLRIGQGASVEIGPRHVERGFKIDIGWVWLAVGGFRAGLG